MRINYLIYGFGHTGGSFFLYKFMDKLCERGYKVSAITPNESIEWRRDSASIILNRLSVPPMPDQGEIVRLLLRAKEDRADCASRMRLRNFITEPIRRYERKAVHR